MPEPAIPADAPAGALGLERTWLDDSSWVDVHRGWADQPEQTYRELTESLPWSQGRIFRYERWVDEPRLSATLGSAPLPPVLARTQPVLQHHYGVSFQRPSFAWYRDGSDSVAFHRDRDMRWLENTVIALLVLGTRRPFLMRPRSNRNDHSLAMAGATHDFAPGAGDLIVMGGAAQAGWEHSVPKVDPRTGGRMSVQWRWTSRTGRPERGASYRAPRLYSR